MNTRDRNRSEFPQIAAFIDSMRAAGFTGIKVERLERIIEK